VKAIGSPSNVALTIATVVFEAALLINQLAQVSEWRRERRIRRRKAPPSARLDRR
jgi:hypothetical protein